MITSNDQFFSLAQVAKTLPNRPNVSTVWRWVVKGVRGHRLPITRIGGRTYVTETDLDAFMEAVNDGPVTAVSAKTRAAELSRVNRDLDRELS